MDNSVRSNKANAMHKLPDDKAIKLNNDNCAYCGIGLAKDASTKEHVIGRKFVPKGKLNGCWNLIVKACKSCNLQKSDLEDDISSITMLPDVYGRYGHDDEEATLDAVRKAQRSISRYTKKTVRNSTLESSIKTTFGQMVTATVNFVGPPHVDKERVFRLACFQLMGFFYWITFDATRRRGGFWPGGFSPVMAAARSDWGNPVHRAFMDAVVQWEPRVLGTTADGFYKIAIRRFPNEDLWSWALEWNKNLRVVGFFGDIQTAQQIASTFPKLEFRVVGEGMSMREEVPLNESEDRLFQY